MLTCDPSSVIPLHSVVESLRVGLSEGDAVDSGVYQLINTAAIDVAAATEHELPLIKALKTSIEKHGLFHPITVSNGKLVSGRLRLLTAKAIGLYEIPARLIEATPNELLMAAKEENFTRKQYTVLEKALEFRDWKALYEKEHPEVRHGGNQKEKNAIRQQTGALSFRKHAELLTTESHKTIERLVKIAKKLSPRVVEAIRTLPTANNQSELSKLAEMTPGEQERLAPLLLKFPTLADAESEFAIAKAQQDAKKYKDLEQCRLFCGDFREIARKHIEDESIPAIVSDPPWLKENCLEIAEPLAEMASRVLTKQGYLIVMLGQYALPEWMNALSKHLQYQWTGCYIHGSGNSTKVPGPMVFSRWKPFLIFSRKDAVLEDRYKQDRIMTETPIRGGGREKSLYEWQQSVSGFEAVLKTWTKPGELIFEPFLGVGTTAIAALNTGRRVIGCELDEGRFKTSQGRIVEAQAKLARRRKF